MASKATFATVTGMPKFAMHKGKDTRSWQQLPPEVIRLIATFYLLDASAAGYCPNTWEVKEMWPSRLVYSVLRDAIELEKLLYLCPAWTIALEHHLFWHHAVTTLDPNDRLAHHAIIQAAPAAGSTAAITYRLSNYRHFRNLTSCCCVICRINAPHTDNGLNCAKRILHTPFLGSLATCRDHRKTTYCGLCMREAPPLEGESEFGVVCCVENEDEESWPGVEATCRTCRSEWLWRRVANNSADREAVGGHRWNSADWETRQSVEAFIDLGEGTISEVVCLAQEKHWLRKYTKLGDMLQQAIAASRYTSRAEAADVGYGSDEDLSEEDEEDDPELMSLHEDAGGIKDTAINDWARNRILDGHWISPADQWYGHTVPNRPTAVGAQHPCPWNKGAMYKGALEEGEQESEGEELEHPRPRTVKADVPPSYQLCEQVYRAFQRQMRDILFPAMANIVRRLVIECAADGLDPAMKAARMSMDDVAQELRDEAAWYNGIDWLERRANRAREQEQERDRERTRTRAREEDDSSSSTRSDGSHTTSPVLSTTTLQTTPSPPPSGDQTSKDDEGEISPTASLPVPTIPIPVYPVLKSPQLLHPIPYIPVTISHLPYYSMEALKLAWREACSPLYQCRCSICERAMLRANMDAGVVVPSQGPHYYPVQQVHRPVPQPPAPVQPAQKPIEIKIQEAPVQEGPPACAEEEEEEEESDDLGESEKEDWEETPVTFPSVTEEKLSDSVTPRKRRSRDFEEEPLQAPDLSETREETPPKRARTGDGTFDSAKVELSPTRMRKRSSEELEDDGPDVQVGNGDAKRHKGDTLPAPPISIADSGMAKPKVVDATGLESSVAVGV